MSKLNGDLQSFTIKCTEFGGYENIIIITYGSECQEYLKSINCIKLTLNDCSIKDDMTKYVLPYEIYENRIIFTDNHIYDNKYKYILCSFINSDKIMDTILKLLNKLNIKLDVIFTINISNKFINTFESKTIDKISTAVDSYSTISTKYDDNKYDDNKHNLYTVKNTTKGSDINLKVSNLDSSELSYYIKKKI